MHLAIQAKVHKEAPEGTYFTVLAPRQSLTDEVSKFSDNGVLIGGLRIDDGRRLSDEQRRKAYATIADIAEFTGHLPEELKEIMKYWYIVATGEDYFSLSDCSITTARHFINYLLDFALLWNIPLRDLLINRTDDINAAIYSSLKRRKCIICGNDGEIHHCEGSRVGMGNNRNKISNENRQVICLCRQHHTELHSMSESAYFERHKVYGIIFRD